MGEDKKRTSMELRENQLAFLELIQDEIGLDSRSSAIRWCIDFVSAEMWSRKLEEEIEAAKKFHLELFEQTEHGKIRVPSTLTRRDEGDKEFDNKEELDEWFNEKIDALYGQDINHLKSIKRSELRAEVEEGECPVCGLRKDSYRKSLDYLAMHIHKKGGRHDNFLENHHLETLEDVKKWLKEQKGRNKTRPLRLDPNFPSSERFPHKNFMKVLSLDSEDFKSENSS